MSKDLDRLAGFNPCPPESGEQWAASAEGLEALHVARSRGDEMELSPSSNHLSSRRFSPRVAFGLAAVLTLAVFIPMWLFGGSGGGEPDETLDSPVAPTTETSQAPGGPSAELLSYLLPISGAEVASVSYIGSAGFQAGLDQTAACMEGEGFSLDFQSSIPPDFVSAAVVANPPYDSLRKYGFIPTWTTPPED